MRRACLQVLLVAAAITAVPRVTAAQLSDHEDTAPKPDEAARSELLLDGNAGLPRDRHWLRMAAEVTVMFGVMETLYWINKEENAFDFEYDADLRNLDERFASLEAWSLDDNYYEVNAWRHPVQGALNYMFARSNGFSALESYAVALAQSATWELFGEYKEEVSVNDLIMTPRSGSVIGESAWQLGVFFLRSDGWPYQVLGNVFSGGRGLLDRFDGKPPLRAGRTGGLGLPADSPHRFEAWVASARQVTGGDARGVVRAGIATELILIPNYDQPGRARTLYPAPAFSEICIEAARDERSLVDFEVFVRTGITTWHRKDLTASRGYNLMYGISSAYDYSFHATPARPTRSTRDQIAVGHIGGGMVDFTVRRDRLQLRAVADGYADFAILRNYAIDAHRAAFPDDPVRSTITRDKYHHALGLTARARMVASLDGLRLGIAFQQDIFRSIQGLDRHQDEIVDDYTLLDQRGEGRAWLAYEIPLREGLALGVEAAIEVRRRSGTVKATRVSDTEQRQVVAVQLVF